MPRKTIFLIASLLLLVIFLYKVTVFIRYSNDHLECDTQVEHSIGKAGEKITLTKHICKERFNF